MTDSVRTVSLDDVERIDLPNDSWSRMVLTEDTAPGTESCLGFSRFTPGTKTDRVSHTVEELAIVLEGAGKLELKGEEVSFEANDAIYIPPETWHSVVNTGESDVVMVFTFPFPAYPPTDRE